VKHGRSFVSVHGPSSVTVASARPSTNQSYRAVGGGGVLPAKNITLASSTRGGNSLNNTRIDARVGHTLSNSTRLNMSQQQQKQQPLPSHALHPNHITDVFPDAISSLVKTEEHTYSSSLNPATNGTHTHSHGGSHSHNPYAPPNPISQHHKVPLRMPVGPSAPPASAAPGSVSDQMNMSGMDDSIYISNHSVAPGEGGPHPHLSASLSADRVVPLQRENLRLVRSNNALQAHLVAEGERIDAKEKEWAGEMRTLKTKHTELQFLFAQKTRKIANVGQHAHVLVQSPCYFCPLLIFICALSGLSVFVSSKKPR
jgi:hypothetical protein